MQVIRRGSASIATRSRQAFATHCPQPGSQHDRSFSLHHNRVDFRLPHLHQTWNALAVHSLGTLRYATTNVRETSSTGRHDGEVDFGRIDTFRQLGEQGLVCQTVVDTLTRDMRMERLTDVQSLTINESRKGRDIVAQARTGTGKTLAFLIPIVQNIIDHDPTLERRSGKLRTGCSSSIRALIISPTRELAEQIAVEAQKVTRDTNILVRTAVGGSNKLEGLRKIRQGCNILVGTPGRLKDILSDPRSGVETPELSILVLDEADRLLEQGFEEDIREIQQLLPDRREVDRQVLLFSATVPQEVMPVVRATMKKDFKFVKTVQEGEQPTHEKVPQKVVNVGPLENQMLALAELCLREVENATPEKRFKAIVFFPTVNEVALAAETLRRFNIFGKLDSRSLSVGFPSSLRIEELHSRLSQRQRTAAVDSFRRAKSALLLSSDVAARGMDFPSVTHVIQVGLPPSEQQYIHRIGRTARAGQAGEAWLLISDLEKRELRFRLKRLPLKADSTLQAPQANMSTDSGIPESLRSISSKLEECTRAVPDILKKKAYVGTYGIFQSYPRKDELVEAANARALHAWGFSEPPLLSHSLAVKLGVSKVPGIRLGEDREPRETSTYGRSNTQRGGYASFNRGDRDRRPQYGAGREDRPRNGFDAGIRYSGGRGDRSRNSFDAGTRDGDGRDDRSRSKFDSSQYTRKLRRSNF